MNKLGEFIVAEKKATINKLLGEIHQIEESMITSNSGKFEEEVRNLLDGVGKGFVGGDYYAPTRYYSSIPGVKNIRFHRSYDDVVTVEVKITSPKGRLIPKKVLGYDVVIYCSSKYKEYVDY